MRRGVVTLMLIAVGLAGCTSGDGDAATTTTSGPTTSVATTTSTLPPTTSTTTTTLAPSAAAEWTVLVYVMGDTDLEPFVLDDIREMASVGSSDQLNIVALVDRHPEFSDEGVLNLDDWEDTKLLSIGQDELVELSGGVELNLGDPSVLADFIEVGITSYPADRYAVILWDHGAGWPGMGPDESDGLDVLDLADIQQGFAEGLARTGVDKVDLVGFDACLMATYEVASVMSNHADFMLASEELEPGHGWDYSALAIALNDPQATAEDLGRSIIDGFAAQAAALDTDEDITLSLLDLSEIEAVQTGLSALRGSFSADVSGLAPVFGRARNRALGFGRNPDPSLDSNMVDLGGLLQQIGQQAQLLAVDETLAAIDDLVVASVEGRASAEASGLAIYFPAFQGNFRQGYLFLEGVPTWPDVLSEFYQAGDAIPLEQQPRFLNEEGLAEYFFDEDGLNIFGTFDLAAQNTVTEAIIFYGVLDESDDSIIFIGQEPGEFDVESGLAGAIYDLTVLSMSDGIDEAFAYIDLTFDPDSGLVFIDIPLVYQAPEAEFFEDVLLSLVVDPETSEVLDETYFVVDESGTFGEITTDPFGLIFPVVLNQFPDGTEEWIPTSDVGLFADLPELQYEFVPLDPGTGLFAELALFDYGGHVASVTMFDLIP